MEWSQESLPSNPAARDRFPAGSEFLSWNWLCVHLSCVLYSVVSVGGSDIVLSTHPEGPDLVCLSSVLVYSLVLTPQTSDQGASGL